MPRYLVYIVILITLFISPSAQAAKVGKAKSMTAEERYEAGLRFMKRGYYTRALEELHRVRNYHRDSPFSLLAQLAVADLYFNKGDFDQARYAYEEFATYHPRHEKLDYVTYRIGLSIYKRAPRAAGRDQSSTRGALNVWTSFATRYPESTHREEVEDYLMRCRNRLAAKELWVAQFYERREAWRAVQARTQTLLKRYPTSDHAPQAMSLLAVALHNWGQSSEAKSVRDDLARQFPDSRYLADLDRELDRPAGEPVPDALFIRPYRIRGAGAAGGAGAPGM